MKIKNLNKKGFTLIELLAVIVVLALIMVLAVPSVLTTMNTAKKKSFQMYGEKLLNKAVELYESESLFGAPKGKPVNNAVDRKPKAGGGYTYEDVTLTGVCYTPEDLGLSSSGSYRGVVVVADNDDNITKRTYYLYLTDGTYSYIKAELSEVQNHPEIIIEDSNAQGKIVDSNNNNVLITCSES